MGASDADQKDPPTAGRSLDHRRSSPRPGSTHIARSSKPIRMPFCSAQPPHRAVATAVVLVISSIASLKPPGSRTDCAKVPSQDPRLRAERHRPQRCTGPSAATMSRPSSPSAWIVTTWSAISSRIGKFGDAERLCVFAVNVAHSAAYPRRIYQIRRQSRAHRRDDAEGGTRRRTGAVGFRRNRNDHQLHGADRGMGSTRSQLLHSGQANKKDRIVSSDGRPGAAARAR